MIVLLNALGSLGVIFYGLDRGTSHIVLIPSLTGLSHIPVMKLLEKRAKIRLLLPECLLNRNSLLFFQGHLLPEDIGYGSSASSHRCPPKGRGNYALWSISFPAPNDSVSVDYA